MMRQWVEGLDGVNVTNARTVGDACITIGGTDHELIHIDQNQIIQANKAAHHLGYLRRDNEALVAHL